MATLHTKDSDCLLDADGQCIECGVSHTAPPCISCGGRGFHSAEAEGEVPCGWTGEKQQPAKNAYEPPREKDEYEKSFKEWRRDDLAWKHREVG